MADPADCADDSAGDATAGADDDSADGADPDETSDAGDDTAGGDGAMDDGATGDGATGDGATGDGATDDGATGAGANAVETDVPADAGDDAASAASSADPFLAWSLASFHAATLLTAGVFVLYAVGALGSLLQGVRTEVGLGLYLALWGLTWRTNRRWLADTEFRGVRKTCAPAMVWGAVTGVGFLAVLLAVVALSAGEVVFVAVLALVGTPVAAVVGTLVGGGFALVDLAVVGVGRRLAGATRC